MHHIVSLGSSQLASGAQHSHPYHLTGVFYVDVAGWLLVSVLPVLFRTQQLQGLCVQRCVPCKAAAARM